MDATDQTVLEKEIHISARPETVFSFFTDPEKLVRWKGIHAQLDPRPGGVYRVDINGRDVILGKYLEVVPYTRIVFTWGLEGEGSPLPPGSTTVEVTLSPEEGGTLVRLRHLGLPPEQRKNHADGWDFYLSRLTQTAEGREVSQDSSFM